MEAPRTLAAGSRCFAHRLCAEVKRLALVLLVLGLVAVAGKYYCFDRLDEEIRQRVQSRLREHYQGLAVTVRSARRIAGRGVEIRGVRIAEGGGGDAPVLVQIDEIFAVCDTRLPDFLTRPVTIQALHIERLKLRAERKPSGLWNIAHLLPQPPCAGAGAPVATIRDAAIEIIDPSQTAGGAPCSWALRNIELTVQPVAPGPRAADAGAAPAAPRLRLGGTLVGDYLERAEFEGELDPVTCAWHLQGAVEGLEFSPRLRAALPREISQALVPLSSIRGRTYFAFQVDRPARGEAAPVPAAASPLIGPLQFVVHGKISEGRIDDGRLPEPLTEVEASLRCDNQGLVIRELSARCGLTQLQLAGSIAGFSQLERADLEISACQVLLERLPGATLPPAVKTTWDRFQPCGLADIEGRLRYDGRVWIPELNVHCQGLSFAYDHFPYRLTDGQGTIVITPGALSAELQMLGGGQQVTCLAQVQQPGEGFVGRVEIRSAGPIPIDDKLLAALAAPHERLVRSFRPRGQIDFAAHFERTAAGAPLARQVRIGLQDCSLQHERFPYPIDKVSGHLELTNDTWSFRRLLGRNDSAQIACEGSWLPAEGGRLDLRFVASDVPLADELWQALPASARRLWANLRPRGHLDRVLVTLGYAAATRRWSVEVQADKWQPPPGGAGRTISLEPVWFPYRLDSVTGHFGYRDGQMQLVNLRALHGPATIQAEGNCRLLELGGSRLELSRLTVDRLTVDEALVAAFPGRFGELLATYPLEGPLAVAGRLDITVPPQPDARPLVDWELALDVENGRLAFATPLEHLHGGVQIAGRQTSEGLFCRGEFHMDSLVVRGVQATHLEGPFWLDGQRIVFGRLAEHGAPGPRRQVTARVLGGLLSVDGQVAPLAEGAFQIEAALENADLVEIARQLAPHQRGLTGRFYGLAQVAGTAGAMHTWRGQGQVRLRDADIYELPVMISLLSLLSVKRPERTAFSSSDIDFRIEGDDLVLERIDFSGDAISLKGTGRMNGQRQIDLKFYPILGREDRQLAIFRPLLGEGGRELMLIEVTGTLDRPDVRRSVFPRIDAQLQQLFPELARLQAQEAPMPILSAPRQALDRLRSGIWR